MEHPDRGHGLGHKQCDAQEFVPSAQNFELRLEKQSHGYWNSASLGREAEENSRVASKKIEFQVPALTSVSYVSDDSCFNFKIWK